MDSLKKKFKNLVIAVVIAGVIAGIIVGIIYGSKISQNERYTPVDTLCINSPNCNGGKVGSAYFYKDGEMVTMWGTVDVSLTPTINENDIRYLTIVLPKPFKNANYALTLGLKTTGTNKKTMCTPSLLISGKTTTSFNVSNTILYNDTTSFDAINTPSGDFLRGCPASYDWIAIGEADSNVLYT